MQTTTILLAVISVAATLTLASLAKAGKTKGKPGKLSDLKGIKARLPLTPFEQKMYFTLKEALPANHVFPQVAFSALITTNDRTTRNRFDRKVADFVICSLALRPLAIVELDDPSHSGKKDQDQERDAMLSNAGYTTIRYASIPTAEKILEDMAKTSTSSPRVM